LSGRHSIEGSPGGERNAKPLIASKAILLGAAFMPHSPQLLSAGASITSEEEIKNDY
jgi:hypothetical protein